MSTSVCSSAWNDHYECRGEIDPSALLSLEGSIIPYPIAFRSLKQDKVTVSVDSFKKCE